MRRPAADIASEGRAPQRRKASGAADRAICCPGRERAARALARGVHPGRLSRNVTYPADPAVPNPRRTNCRLGKANYHAIMRGMTHTDQPILDLPYHPTCSVGLALVGGRPDNGPLSRLRFPRGCVAFTVLKPGSKSQRLFQLIVGIGPPGGLLDGGQRVLPRPRSATLADRLFSELARSGRIASGWVLVGRTPLSLMLFAVAAGFQQVTARQEQWNAHRRQRTGSWPPAF